MTPKQLAARKEKAKSFKAARHNLGLTQVALAARLEVNVRQIKRWEAGDSPILATVRLAMSYLGLFAKMPASPSENLASPSKQEGHQ